MTAAGWNGRVATCVGVGFITPGPGTWGSLAALPPAVLVLWLAGAWGLTAATLAVSVLGILTSGRYVRVTGQKDPPEVVIDEVAGQWLTLLPFAFLANWTHWYLWPLGFALFRLFDVIKPWPCDNLERLPEGFGVMCDDLMAGLYAALAMTLAILLLGVA